MTTERILERFYTGFYEHSIIKKFHTELLILGAFYEELFRDSSGILWEVCNEFYTDSTSILKGFEREF